jgi:hypothetical protein
LVDTVVEPTVSAIFPPNVPVYLCFLPSPVSRIGSTALSLSGQIALLTHPACLVHTR